MSKNENLSQVHAASLLKGVKVKMVNCFEVSYHQDEIYTVRSDEPVLLGGDWGVWLEGYPGAFRCDFLQIVNI